MALMAESIEGARRAGWNPADGPAPFTHPLPPADDPALRHNGVPAPAEGDPDFVAPEQRLATAARVDLRAILAEHWHNVGFVEGPNNANPWGPEQGVSSSAYCDSAASIVPYHHAHAWWSECTFGAKGCAYCPDHVRAGEQHGAVRYDHTSRGEPADVLAGDLLFYDWNGDGVADHVETAVDDCPSNGRTHNIGYNTGTPEGCHEIWRDRTYLLCRLRPGYPAIPQVLDIDGAFGPLTIAALQRVLKVNPDGAFGPATKRALQAYLKVTVDGDIGPETVQALQRHVGATPDGDWGPDTTKALQRALNAGTF
jgi:peptidoglycan hydrolase-like protein with peptidoglycan-binding domain